MIGKVVILLIIATMTVSSVVPITRFFAPVPNEEDAVAICKAYSQLVKEGLEKSRSYGVEVRHLNLSMVNQMKMSHPESYADVPVGHDAWDLVWYFAYEDKPGSYAVIVVLDAVTGHIVHEELGAQFL